MLQSNTSALRRGVMESAGQSGGRSIRAPSSFTLRLSYEKVSGFYLYFWSKVIERILGAVP